MSVKASEYCHVAPLGTRFDGPVKPMLSPPEVPSTHPVHGTPRCAGPVATKSMSIACVTWGVKASGWNKTRLGASYAPPFAGACAGTAGEPELAAGTEQAESRS